MFNVNVIAQQKVNFRSNSAHFKVDNVALLESSKTNAPFFGFLFQLQVLNLSFWPTVAPLSLLYLSFSFLPAIQHPSKIAGWLDDLIIVCWSPGVRRKIIAATDGWKRSFHRGLCARVSRCLTPPATPDVVGAIRRSRGLVNEWHIKVWAASSLGENLVSHKLWQTARTLLRPFHSDSSTAAAATCGF